MSIVKFLFRYLSAKADLPFQAAPLTGLQEASPDPSFHISGTISIVSDTTPGPSPMKNSAFSLPSSHDLRQKSMRPPSLFKASALKFEVFFIEICVLIDPLLSLICFIATWSFECRCLKFTTCKSCY